MGRARERTTSALALLTLLLVGAGCRPVQPGSAEKPKNVLKWVTRADSSTLGFDIYRAEAAGGAREKITTEPVPSITAGASGGHVYVYEDIGIDPTRAYDYTIETVTTDGRRFPLSTIRSKPKLPKGP